MIATILTLCSTISAQRVAPSDQLTMYFEADDLPNAVVWLPAPPDTTSTQFLYDITQYMWGKEQRYINKERAKQAIDNATTDVAEMAQQFSGAFGMEITPEKTPAIFKVLYRGVLTCRLSATKTPICANGHTSVSASYQWGMSRVIAGYHWQSDVDASFLLTSGCYARLHTSPEFLADMAAARAEYAKKHRMNTN